MFRDDIRIWFDEINVNVEPLCRVRAPWGPSSISAIAELVFIQCAALQYKAIIDCFLLRSRTRDAKECSMGC